MEKGGVDKIFLDWSRVWPKLLVFETENELLDEVGGGFRAMGGDEIWCSPQDHSTSSWGRVSMMT